MDPAMKAEIAEALKHARSELARKGGLGRAKALTAKERRESALKASRAAVAVRKRKAKERKKGQK